MRCPGLLVLSLICFLFAHISPLLLAESSCVIRTNKLSAVSDAQRPRARFAPAVTYDTGGLYALGVAVGDLNGDGTPDLVVVNASQNGGSSKDGVVGVLLGNGDGTFQNAVAYDSGGIGTNSVAIGDVNGDGYLDVVVANIDSNSVSVLLGKGDGTFQAPVSYNAGPEPYLYSLADLRSNGRLDIVVSNEPNPYVVSVLLGNGDGTFQTPLGYSGCPQVFSLTIGDVNGDRLPDLVVTVPDTVGVALGNGDGTFQAMAYYSSGGQIPEAIAIGDLNGDGYPDLAVANQCTFYCPRDDYEGPVGVLLGNGDGTFRPPVLYGSHGHFSDSIAIADMNGDGYPDLVVANECQKVDPSADCIGPPEIAVLLNIGNGTFPYHSDFVTGNGEDYEAAIGDLNLDGRPDLVGVNWNAFGNGPSTAGVLLNTLTYKTSTALTSSPNPAQVHQPVIFTATITASQAIPDGQVVSFYSGKTKIGAGTTRNGVATLTTSFSRARTYAIKASYEGEGFLKASSGTVKQVVNP